TLISGLSGPKGVAVDSGGTVYVADTGNNALKSYAGSTLTTLIASGLSGPQGLVVDGSGNLYVADTGNNAVKKAAQLAPTATPVPPAPDDTPIPPTSTTAPTAPPTA